MTWVVERAACRCGHRFATFEAHMAHAVYVKGQSRPIQHLDPGEIGLYFDGVEWTHLPPVVEAPAADPVEPSQPVRRTDTKRLVCAECGTLFSKRPGRGRPPKRCYECKGTA